MGELLQIGVERGGPTVHVTLTGELDLLTSRELRAVLADIHRGDQHQRLLLDLRELTFIDSTGLETVIRAEAACRRNGTKLTVVKGPPHVHRVFVIIGMDNHLELVDEP